MLSVGAITMTTIVIIITIIIKMNNHALSLLTRCTPSHTHTLPPLSSPQVVLKTIMVLHRLLRDSPPSAKVFHRLIPHANEFQMARFMDDSSHESKHYLSWFLFLFVSFSFSFF